MKKNGNKVRSKMTVAFIAMAVLTFIGAMTMADVINRLIGLIINTNQSYLGNVEPITGYWPLIIIWLLLMLPILHKLKTDLKNDETEIKKIYYVLPAILFLSFILNAHELKYAFIFSYPGTMNLRFVFTALNSTLLLVALALTARYLYFKNEHFAKSPIIFAKIVALYNIILIGAFTYNTYQVNYLLITYKFGAYTSSLYEGLWGNISTFVYIAVLLLAFLAISRLFLKESIWQKNSQHG